MVSGFLLLRAFGFFSVNGLPACGTDNATRTKRSNGGKNHDTIRKMRLGLVLIYVKDLDRMAAFYGEILGLRAIESTRTESWVEFGAGGIRFGLHAIPAAIAEGIEIASPPRARKDNPIKLSFAVEDVASERRRLESLGVPLVERPWGSCDGIDPEGNVFGLYPVAEI